MHDKEIDFSHPVNRYISDAEFSSLPEQVVKIAKKCVVDTLAAIIVGSRSELGQIASRYATTVWAQGRSTVFSNGESISAVGAGFANGVSANGTDIDDVGRYTWGHPGAVVVPAALALAQEQDATGAEMLCAVVVGYEVAFRSGRILNYGLDPTLLGARREYRACGSWGAPTVAAIAGNLRRQPLDQIAHALGIAEYHAPEALMLRDTEAPAMVKHAIGPGILAGILASDLSAIGFTGVPSLLLSPRFDKWTRDIGRVFHLPSGVSFKRYSCCSFAHAALEAVEQLMKNHGHFADRVKKVLVETYSDAVLLGTRVPETTAEAQFSVAWSIAALLLDGDVHPRAMQPSRLRDRSTRELAKRVELIENEELTRLFLLSEAEETGGKEAAIVHITLSDGTVLSSGIVENILFPVPPPSAEMIEAKFRWATGDELSGSIVDRILEICRNLESVNDLSELVKLASVQEKR